MNLKEASPVELKAFIYDCMAEQNRLQQLVSMANEELKKRLEAKPVESPIQPEVKEKTHGKNK